jgi:4,5-DOPA dioxygenase extradiol
MKLNDLNRLFDPNHSTETMPVLFLGHGSPMNAIEENEFVAGFRQVATTIPHPTAILCVSAHWETRGTYVTAMDKPATIHDFGGFPQALFDVQYAAPGSPELAAETKLLIKTTEVGFDKKWGLDHGAWSVMKHLYPAADVPVVQMSLDYYQTPQYHYELMKELASLRQKGVLVVGSGNMVHNLSQLAWSRMGEDNFAFDWALEAGEKMKSFILTDNHKQLINYRCHGKAFELAIPTPEHYLPLLYALSLKTDDEPVALFNDKAVGGSLLMTSVKIG